VYDVSPERLGSFDFVFIGSVLIHLRDPVRALRALRTVTSTELRSFDVVLFWSSLLRPNALTGTFYPGSQARWWTPSAATHRRWVTASGFEITASKRFIFQRQGALRKQAAKNARRLALRARQRGWMLRKIGVPSQLIVAK
jgi:tRNA (mo5U34)-methyltransferase